MVAQMLMQPVGRESLDNSIADENFFQPIEIPSESMVAPLDMQGGFFKGPNTDNQNMTVEPGMLLPFERTAEGRLQFATPQLVAGILEGLQQAGQTIQKGVSGDPMFVPVDGKLSEQAIDEITNLGLTMGGTAYTGSSLIPGLVPEGVLASTLKGSKKTTDVASDASKIDLPSDSSKVNNLDMGIIKAKQVSEGSDMILEYPSLFHGTTVKNLDFLDINKSRRTVFGAIPAINATDNKKLASAFTKGELGKDPEGEIYNLKGPFKILNLKNNEGRSLWEKTYNRNPQKALADGYDGIQFQQLENDRIKAFYKDINVDDVEDAVEIQLFKPKIDILKK
tara:strand:- start:391 stop:1401 length:1011 start_codon:yes stop_codon:yes gene_type:complete